MPDQCAIRIAIGERNLSADTIVYCLERLTDYDQFERLCHDLMCSEGHPTIEPLGGVKDKGRDALHVHRGTGVNTVFAYSVQEDWRTKLEKDAHKVRGHGHSCQRLAFLCNARFTANERDEAVSFVRQEFGWELELYGLERLRTLLTTRHARLVPRHPQIFPPAFFPPTAPGVDVGSTDYLFIDYADEDAVLAVWLARRLTAAGYRV